ncbi:MAG: hypothetical protein JWR70_2840 [Modestobacter sp.]|nr:hypothetical protein [Modestobacter sp.]
MNRWCNRRNRAVRLESPKPAVPGKPEVVRRAGRGEPTTRTATHAGAGLLAVGSPVRVPSHYRFRGRRAPGPFLASPGSSSGRSTWNGGRRREQVLAGTSEVVTWRCDRGPDHAWRVSVVSRTAQKNGCPCCRGFQVSVTNSLATLCPKIATELDPARNHGLTAEQVTARSNRRSPGPAPTATSGAPWSGSGSGRWKPATATARSAPRDASHQQLAIASALAHALPGLAVDPRPETIVTADARWRADITVGELRLVVEFDGSYYHRGREEHDARKSADLRRAGWTVVRMRETPLRATHSHDLPVPPRPPKAADELVAALVPHLLTVLPDAERRPAPRGPGRPAHRAARLDLGTGRAASRLTSAEGRRLAGATAAAVATVTAAGCAEPPRDRAGPTGPVRRAGEARQPDQRIPGRRLPTRPVGDAAAAAAPRREAPAGSGRSAHRAARLGVGLPGRPAGAVRGRTASASSTGAGSSVASAPSSSSNCRAGRGSFARAREPATGRAGSQRARRHDGPVSQPHRGPTPNSTSTGARSGGSRDQPIREAPADRSPSPGPGCPPCGWCDCCQQCGTSAYLTYLTYLDTLRQQRPTVDNGGQRWPTLDNGGHREPGERPQGDRRRPRGDARG